MHPSGGPMDRKQASAGLRASRRKLAALTTVALLCLVGAVLGSGALAACAVASPLYRAYVADEDSDAVTPINLTTELPEAAIPVGVAPEAIAITPNGQTVLVANVEGETVTPIAVATNTPGVPISLHAEPEGIAIAPNGQTAYVTTADAVIPIALATDTPGTPINVVGAYGIAITPNGETAYVTGGPLANTVTPINLTSRKAEAAIPVGEDPAEIAISPNGESGYVTTFLSNTVTVVSMHTRATNTHSYDFHGPFGVAVAPPSPSAYLNESVYITNFNMPYSLTALFKDQNLLGEIDVGSEPFGVAIAPSSEKAYVTNVGEHGEGRVTSFDLGGVNGHMEVDRNISLAGFAPRDIAIVTIIPPEATVSAPESGETYTENAVVKTTFSCEDGGNGPGIASCKDSNGASGGSGQLDTSAPGKYVYTVTAKSKDGQEGQAQITYTVVPPPPSVSRLGPDSGPPAGGTEVTIIGSNFSEASAVSFGGTPASFAVNSNTSITAVSPEGSGSVDVTVTNPGGTSATNVADKFSYLSGPPQFGRCAKVGKGDGPYANSGCSKTAAAGAYAFSEGTLKSGLSFSGTTSKIELASKDKIECKAATGTGHYDSSRNLNRIQLVLSECESLDTVCTSEGARPGEIKTSVLEAGLGFEAAAKKRVGLDFVPANGTGLLLSAKCGETPWVLHGSVIAPIKADKMAMTTALKFKASKGKQKPEHLEGEANDVLEASVDGSPYTPVGLTGTLTLSSEEEVEVAAVA